MLQLLESGFTPNLPAGSANGGNTVLQKRGRGRPPAGASNATKKLKTTSQTLHESIRAKTVYVRFPSHNGNEQQQTKKLVDFQDQASAAKLQVTFEAAVLSVKDEKPLLRWTNKTNTDCFGSCCVRKKAAVFPRPALAARVATLLERLVPALCCRTIASSYCRDAYHQWSLQAMKTFAGGCESSHIVDIWGCIL
jgi:hypothetical protein